MATLQASIQLQDRMSSVLNNITQSMAFMLNTFEATQAATDAGFKAAAMDSARQGIAQASAELIQYNEELRKAATIPEPRIPEPTWQRMSAQDVFMGSGATRFEEEMRSADIMARQLYQRQQEITAQANRMKVTPPGMLNDVAAVQNRIQMLQQRVQTLNSIPVDLRTDRVNNEIEVLRGNLNQASQVQERLSIAMGRMDINHVNAEYQRLNVLLSNAEQGIRDMDIGQQQFNNRVRDGTRSANGLMSVIARIGATIGTVLGVKQVIELSDSMTQITARLNLMAGESANVAAIQEQIFQSAQRSRTEYMATADVVSKLGLRAGAAFSSTNEVIQFAEILNKQFVIAGASQQEIASASLQLTQALGSGVLRGEELNAVFEAAPNVIQTIADYIGRPIGEIRQLASDGLITADIVKNAMIYASEEVNAQFEQMPKTFGQIWTSIKNQALMSFQPILQRLNVIANSPRFREMVDSTIIGFQRLAGVVTTVFEYMIQGASWVRSNWSYIEPILWGIVGALGAYSIATALQAFWTGTSTAAIFLQTLATRGLTAALLACPLTWIAIAIGAVIAAIVIWVRHMGGIKVAWLICVNTVLTKAELLQMGLMVIWHKVQNGLDIAQLGFMALKTGVLNALGALKVGGLIILQDFINGAIDRINQLITLTNRIAGTSIETISRVEFGTNAVIEEKGKQKQRADEMAAQRNEIRKNQKSRAQAEYWAAYEFNHNRMKREAAIEAARSDNAAKSEGSAADQAAINDIGKYTGDIAGNTAKMADTMDILDEELKYMRDAAEQEVINRFTLAELKVDVKNSNTLTKKTDFDDMGRYLASFTNEFLATAAEGGHL